MTRQQPFSGSHLERSKQTATDIRPAGRNHRLLASRRVGTGSYVLEVSRDGLDFAPGHHLHIGLAGSLDTREYSVYSGVADDALEVLIREVPDGLVSRQLRRARPGDPLRVEGPYGFFTLEQVPEGAPLLFVATGTGIAPFRSFVRSYRGLDYLLLHGIRNDADRFEYDDFDAESVLRCVSQAEARSAGTGDTRYAGRVTDYLLTHPVAPETHCFLCGNCDMIYDAFDILKAQGVAPERLYAEVYF